MKISELLSQEEIFYIKGIGYTQDIGVHYRVCTPFEVMLQVVNNPNIPFIYMDTEGSFNNVMMEVVINE